MHWHKHTHPNSFIVMHWHKHTHPNSFIGMHWHTQAHPNSFIGMHWHTQAHPQSCIVIHMHTLTHALAYTSIPQFIHCHLHARTHTCTHNLYNIIDLLEAYLCHGRFRLHKRNSIIALSFFLSFPLDLTKILNDDLSLVRRTTIKYRTPLA